MTALLSVVVFVIDVLIVAAAQMFIVIVLCLIAKIPFKKVFAYGKFMAPFIALLIGLQALLGQGLSGGLMIGCRIITLIMLMSLLTATTDARQLALGITRLGLPYKAAYVMSSALNIVPSFEEEARLIMDARKLRGVKSIRFIEYPSIALPLIIKAMRQAHMTGLAMDTRAFGAYKTRTWLREMKFSSLDRRAFAAGIAASAAMITAHFLLKG